MRLDEAGKALRRAMKEARFSTRDPSFSSGFDGLLAFANEAVDGVSELPNSDTLLFEFTRSRVQSVAWYTVGLYRQLDVPEGDGDELYRFGIELELDDSPALLAVTPKPQKSFDPIIEHWGDTSEIDTWASTVRNHEAFSAFVEAQVTKAEVVEDRM